MFCLFLVEKKKEKRCRKKRASFSRLTQRGIIRQCAVTKQACRHVSDVLVLKLTFATIAGASTTPTELLDSQWWRWTTQWDESLTNFTHFLSELCFFWTRCYLKKKKKTFEVSNCNPKTSWRLHKDFIKTTELHLNIDTQSGVGQTHHVMPWIVWSGIFFLYAVCMWRLLPNLIHKVSQCFSELCSTSAEDHLNLLLHIISPKWLILSCTNKKSNPEGLC